MISYLSGKGILSLCSASPVFSICFVSVSILYKLQGRVSTFGNKL